MMCLWCTSVNPEPARTKSGRAPQGARASNSICRKGTRGSCCVHTESSSLMRRRPGATALHGWAQGTEQIWTNKHTWRPPPRRPQLKASAAMRICCPPTSASARWAEGRAKMEGRPRAPNEDPAFFRYNSGWALATSEFRRRIYYPARALQGCKTNGSKLCGDS